MSGEDALQNVYDVNTENVQSQKEYMGVNTVS